MSPQPLNSGHWKPIRFRFAPGKTRAAILWMLEQVPRLDLHTVLKTCYFADKDHLNKHRRPIFGATYRAMRFGPVPLEIYEMTKGDPIWLSELDVDSYPWRLDGHHLQRVSNSAADLSELSKSDVVALQGAFSRCSSMTFNERTAATHGPDWQAANMDVMSYEDMIDESDTKDETVEYLREAGRFMRL
jgi:uncharacterized phage-associated protein